MEKLADSGFASRLKQPGSRAGVSTTASPGGTEHEINVKEILHGPEASSGRHILMLIVSLCRVQMAFQMPVSNTHSPIKVDTHLNGRQDSETDL